MTKHLLRTLVFSIWSVLVISGCGGGSSNSSSVSLDPVPVISVTGLWEIPAFNTRGFIPTTCMLDQKIFVDSHQISSDWHVGQYEIEGDRFSAKIIRAILSTATFPYPVDIEADIVEEETLQGTLTTTYAPNTEANPSDSPVEETEEFTGTYMSLNHIGASHAEITGLWNDSLTYFSTPVDTVSSGWSEFSDPIVLDVKEDGSFFGNSERACTYTGNLGVIDTEINVFLLEVEVLGECATADWLVWPTGNYHGCAWLENEGQQLKWTVTPTAWAEREDRSETVFNRVFDRL